jgi:hypothetical protein
MSKKQRWSWFLSNDAGIYRFFELGVEGECEGLVRERLEDCWRFAGSSGDLVEFHRLTKFRKIHRRTRQLQAKLPSPHHPPLAAETTRKQLTLD